VYYYFLVDGTIYLFIFFPPFFSFVLKFLVSYLFSVGLEQLSKVSLGSINVFGLAYILTNVLIINFFLFAFFWVFVDTNPIIDFFNSNSNFLENDLESDVASVAAATEETVYPEGGNLNVSEDEVFVKPFLILYAEEHGIEGLMNAEPMVAEEIPEVWSKLIEGLKNNK
jgi:hypothetical protein